MKSKILAFVLMLTMVLTSAVEVAATVQVTDITGNRSEAIIREAISLGVIKGYPDGTFRPDGLIKREEFFSIINNILTVRPVTTNTKLDFIDVDPIEWYVPVIKTVTEAKITNGIGWGKVGIGLNITRQEAVKILATIIQTKYLPVASVQILANDKTDIAQWALPYYQIMFKKGYLNNSSVNLVPMAALTREEAAILLLKIKKSETVIAGNANVIITEPVISGGGITNVSQSAIDGTFVAGKGTQDDPYQVSTQDQLNNVRLHLTEGAFFVMTNNIKITKDFETNEEAFLSAATDWSDGNFQPIGTKGNPFVGTFNGNGYKIEGLNIIGTVLATEITGARELTSYAGLFGSIGASSIISNIMIENSQIFGKEYTGGIAGYNQGIIRNTGIGDTTVIKGSSFTGGIAGYSDNLIEKCFSKVNIQGNTATGAIIGKNYGVLRNSYWLDTSYPQSVGVSGMTSSISEVKQVTLKEFTDQNIVQLLK